MIIESGGFKNSNLSEKLNKYECTNKYFKYSVLRKEFLVAQLYGEEKKNAKILNLSKSNFINSKIWPISYSELNKFKLKILKNF